MQTAILRINIDRSKVVPSRRLSALGHGERIVVVRFGRRWCYILNPFTLATARVQRRTFESLWHQAPAPTDVRPAYLFGSISRSLFHAGRTPTRIEAAILDWLDTADLATSTTA